MTCSRSFGLYKSETEKSLFQTTPVEMDYVVFTIPKGEADDPCPQYYQDTRGR